MLLGYLHMLGAAATEDSRFTYMRFTTSRIVAGCMRTLHLHHLNQSIPVNMNLQSDKVTCAHLRIFSVIPPSA
eukprot:jgi/Chrzof1/1816/Cz10g22080.t1